MVIVSQKILFGKKFIIKNYPALTQARMQGKIKRLERDCLTKTTRRTGITQTAPAHSHLTGTWAEVNASHGAVRVARTCADSDTLEIKVLFVLHKVLDFKD
jgi:hypothetical protein